MVNVANYIRVILHLIRDRIFHNPFPYETALSAFQRSKRERERAEKKNRQLRFRLPFLRGFWCGCTLAVSKFIGNLSRPCLCLHFKPKTQLVIFAVPFGVPRKSFSLHQTLPLREFYSIFKNSLFTTLKYPNK